MLLAPPPKGGGTLANRSWLVPKEHIANLVKVMISAMPSVRSGHPGFQSCFFKTDWLVKTSPQIIC